MNEADRYTYPLELIDQAAVQVLEVLVLFHRAVDEREAEENGAQGRRQETQAGVKVERGSSHHVNGKVVDDHHKRSVGQVALALTGGNVVQIHPVVHAHT